MARSFYLTDQGLSRHLLVPQFAYCPDNLRLPVARTLFPFAAASNASILGKAIDLQDTWLYVPTYSPWKYIRDVQMSAMEQGGFEARHTDMGDDLLFLQYVSLFAAIKCPLVDTGNRLQSSVADWLMGHFFALESLRLGVVQLSQAKPGEGEDTDGRVRPIADWKGMTTQMHLSNCIVRLRACWDKLTINVIPNALNLSDSAKSDKFKARLRKLDDVLAKKSLPTQARAFWRALHWNTSEAAADGGLREIRDADLHFISKYTREAFPTTGTRIPSNQELLSVAVEENYRLQDSWMLTWALLLECAATSQDEVTDQRLCLEPQPG